MKRIIAGLNGALLLLLTGCSDRTESGVGIIGGADWPTYQYIVSHLIDRYFFVAVIAVFVIFAGVLWYRRK